MKLRRDVLIAVLVTFCLTLALLAVKPIGSQIQRQYDPWMDINDDGIIDYMDIVSTCRLFGTTGDPTKNVNVTNWPIDEQGNLKTVISPKILKGAERIVLLENFLGKIRFDVNEWPEAYFAFIPKGELINITGVYCNIIYSSTAYWSSAKFVYIGINNGWSRRPFLPISTSNENQMTKYNITDISSQINIGINRAYICHDVYRSEATVYLNYWELIVEYYYKT
jgi:hypothetical protein